MRHLILAALLVAACHTDEGDTDEVVDDTDVTCAFTRADGDAPTALQAGIAKARIPAPVGIGTAGYGPFGAPKYATPFASIYPGTKKLHGHPEIKAVALSRGAGHEVVFVRIDAVGVFHQLRTDVVQRVSERLGRDMDHAIVLGATHTHSGPGRVVNTNTTETGFFDLIADKFMPEFYDRFVATLADTIVAAFDDLQPAEVAFVDGNCPDGHADRRCEDGPDYQNGTLPIIAVRQQGELAALVSAYAVHGTVLSIDDQYLSQDVHGAIEEAIEDRFDHPVESLSFNAWGADMSPGSPQDVPHVLTGVEDGNQIRFRDIGWTVANSVETALEGATWTSEPEIALETHRITIDREHIGYTPAEFPYEYGGVYCKGRGDGATCDPPMTHQDDLLDGCVPFNQSFPAPSDTITTVGRLGDFAFVSWPGEPGTKLVEALLDRIRAAYGVDRFFFAGYAQDYLGYSLLEEDWWYGGYEASGALWGPKQGQYLSDRIVDAYDSYATQSCPQGEPAPLEPFPYSLDHAYTSETGLDVGTIAVPPLAVYGATDTIEVTVYGRDPWDGAPLAWLEDADGAPLLRSNGMRVESDDFNFEVELSVDPAYPDAPPPASRHFAWTFRMPVRQPVEGTLAIPPGTWKLVVDVGTGEPVVSDPFVVVDLD